MNIRRFKQTQRFRINVGQVSFYATAKQIRNALDSLEFMRSDNGAACGIGGTWEGLSVQLTAA
jgi:exopolyphosphatase/pppGpp-phosphohydrolase